MRESGNTVAEYGIIAVVVLVGVSALMLLTGENLDKALQGLKGDLSKNIASAKQHSQVTATTANDKQTSSSHQASASDSNTSPGFTKLCTASQKGKRTFCINLPDEAADKFVATTGGLGSSNLTAREFASVVAKVMASMELEDRQKVVYQVVAELANTGHNIGKAEKALQVMCRSGDVCNQGVSTIIPDNPLETLVVRKNQEIQNRSDEFIERKEVLDTIITAAPAIITPTDMNIIENNSDEIVETAASKDGSAVSDIISGNSANTIISDSNAICLTVDEVTQQCQQDVAQPVVQDQNTAPNMTQLSPGQTKKLQKKAY